MPPEKPDKKYFGVLAGEGAAGVTQDQAKTAMKRVPRTFLDKYRLVNRKGRPRLLRKK